MQGIRHILIPIRDLQTRASPAIRKAVQLAQASAASIELFHAIATPMPLEILSTRGQSLKDIKSQGRHACLATLERLASPLRRLGLQVSTSVAWDFPPYEAIIRRALATKADLIVTQGHERHRLAGLLGYTDWELLRLSPVPVLLIKTPRLYHRASVLAALDPTHPNAKSSALDKRILEHATQLSLALRGTLQAVHAYFPEPQLPPSGMRVNDIIPVRAIKAAQGEARRDFAASLPKNAVKSSHQHVGAGSPAEVIPAIARKTRSAIVVLGAVSRSGLKRLFIGNTAEKVLDDLHCDVLIVKPDGLHPRLARARRGVQFVPTAIPMGV